ncbi:hypothetical protein ISS03_00055 [Patescibacteria group bacterium]|nr:hypothetical protein [Patescibacteria group bacterium]
MRSVFLSVTHDEAVTVMYHVQNSLYDILYFQGSLLSNHHLLNTLLIKFTTTIFGLNEFVARVPVLFGALLYLSGVLVISKKLFNENFLIFSSVVLLSVNPFVIDFFSLARGYSLAIGTFIWALIYFLKWVGLNDGRVKRKYLFIVFSCLTISTLSNLAFLNVYLGSIVVVLFFEAGVLRNSGKSIVQKFVYVRDEIVLPIVPSLLLLLTIYYFPVVAMNGSGEFYFGGVNNLWSDTINSLIEATLYGINYRDDIIKIIAWVFLSMQLVTGIVLVLAKCGKYFVVRREFGLILLLIVSILLGIEAQNIFFGTRYLVERAAIFLLPLFMLQFLGVWMVIIASRARVKNIFNVIGIVVIFFCYIHFLNSLNYNSSFVWGYDANSREAVEKIARLKESGVNIHMIGSTWILAPSLSFYRYKFGMFDIDPITRKGPDNIYDVYYLRPEDAFLVSKYHLKVVSIFKPSNNILAIRYDNY